MKKILNKISKYADAIVLLVISIAFGVNHNWGGAAGFMMASFLNYAKIDIVDSWEAMYNESERCSDEWRDKYWELKYGHKYGERK